VDAVAVVWSRRAQRDRDCIFSDMAAQATPARAYAVIHASGEHAAWLGENSDGGVEIGPQAA
jgi:plasmid stabilization system protein ParE